MVDIAALLDQLEEWIEAQVPQNLSELPAKMLETAERMTNELMDTLTMHGPPSISIPFPPFAKEVPPPPPPPPPAVYSRITDLARRHPCLVAGAVGLTLTASIGAIGMTTGVGVFGAYGREWRLRRRFGVRGVVEGGMLQEAIVILAPSPTPPLLVPLTASLLKNGYVVIVAVPHVKEAEALERRLSGLAEKTALRVLIYDTEDSTTFPPFHRSLLATLTLRFPGPSSSSSSTGGYAVSDPYNPAPSQIPHIHAFISLYPLNPAPPSQPSPLPALPTLVQPTTGKPPMLLTLYPAAAGLVTPDSFASQVLSATHQLLGANLAAATSSRVVSLFLGHITLPSLPAIITEGRTLSRRELARQRLRESAASPTAAFSIVRDLIASTLCGFYRSIAGALGLAPSRDYAAFETRLLRTLKTRCGTNFYAGQRSWLAHRLASLPPTVLPRVLSIMPPMPSETGPAPPPPPKSGGGSRSAGSRSASSSDHEAEDLVSSIHTAGTTQSSADSSVMDGSWVVDA
ncbi:hypothetical protein CC85DRAFT_288107 [Cutaneotrichosporon oleaginosum]|uniref:DUF1776-domain-containing protein n=1 Tax=Cutaneotrichosporon oleaginosum TaxID=879819 RepID=A0A0J1AX13_9TREE|nr:uncharacterized protein CC85DRAFT_288107 [Cutaneotrichosporon oleaginosum]KLT39849.1 hypothetical protein CC85DRAFT_288107 [Cutaneotrichosporon oleaginosum]TXT05446.1 hypothetical protein COLE_06766 [Cutaneotrichosporon oleaginosum]